MSKEKVIVITASDELSVREVERKPNGLMNDDLQKIVAGWIEVVHPVRLPDPYVLVCNEEGKIIGLPNNRACSLLYGCDKHGIPMEGDIIVMKEGFVNGEPDIIGLTDEDIGQLTEKLMTAYTFLKKVGHE